jgi:two-component system CheB/CheR fusion protein
MHVGVVGLGASAGGLEALSQFLEAVPPDANLAFVVVQHLDRHHPSLLPELLARRTQLRVEAARDGAALEPGLVLVAPPDTLVTVRDGRVQVGPAPATAPRLGVDALFRSLAEAAGEDAVAVVLSGAGSDGVLGARAVKERGGLVLAQDPSTAAHAGMPREAIEAGVVDLVLEPRLMPARLLASGHPWSGAGAGAEARAEAEVAAALPAVCEALRGVTSHDFSGYKRSTLQRRVTRRLHLRGVAAEDYPALLRRDPEEAQRLQKDLLICVTEFFRDPAAFEALAGHLLPLLAAKEPRAPVRVWVPGCASGEEAYSLAILLREALAASGERPLQIFATDLDPQRIAIARQGRYPASIAAQVGPKRLARWFVRDGEGWAVSPALRELCAFSTHSLVRDPPFSGLDLVSCRNVLIYLAPELQRRVVRLFHYALRPGGLLFLGPSESPGAHADLFLLTDERHRILRRNDAALRAALDLPLSRGLVPLPPAAAAASPPSPTSAFERMLLEEFAPASVVCDERGEILYFAGRTARWLQPPTGAPSHNLLELARGALALELRLAIFTVARHGRGLVRELTAADAEGQERRLRVTVRPLPGAPAGARLFAIVLQEDGPAAAAAAAAAEAAPPAEPGVLVEQLATELRTTRADLQAAVEELASANEDLRASNEELLSTNEELQSTNEELQTSQEELQSVNEELQTVNGELAGKVQELAATNDALTEARAVASARAEELAKVLDVAPLPIFMAHDPACGRITSNRAAADLLRVPADANVSQTPSAGEAAPVIRHYAGGRELAPSELPLQRAIAEGRAVLVDDLELVLPDGARRHVSGGAVPLLAPDGRVRGGVAAYADVTGRRRAELALREADRRKDEFLAMLSHELRNPLAAIRNGLAVLERAPPGGEQARRARAVIDRQGTHLSRLVDDLLDVTRIARGKIELTREPLDLAELVRRAVEDHRAVFAARNVALELPEGGGAVPVLGDATRLAQAVGNVLHNAAKFTPAGGHARVSVAREGERGVVRVRDDGAGVAPEVAPHLFQPFVQGAPTLDRAAGGLGLGLALVRALVELHGGRASLRSAGAGQGTEVTLEVPLGGATPRRGLELPPSHAPSRRVLLIEDNVDAAETLRDALALSGHVVEVAHDGPEGVAAARRSAPDVVLCDIGLPGMSGYEVARALRSDPSLGEVLLVALTGYATSDDVAKARAAGFDQHLAKPPRVSDLEALLAAPPLRRA